jgi:type II secretory pathway predicted ATPase ExeA
MRGLIEALKQWNRDQQPQQRLSLRRIARETGTALATVHHYMHSWSAAPASWRADVVALLARSGFSLAHLFREEEIMLTIEQQALEHFGFQFDPFTNELDSDFGKKVWLSRNAKWVRDHALHLIHNRAFFAIVGEIGTGKSLLADLIVSQLEDAHVARPWHVDKEKLTAGAIYDSVLLDICKVPQIPRTKETRARRMVAGLESRQEQNCLLIVDEAHRLHWSTLAALKQFYDFRLRGRRLLSIMLIGQPPLAQIFREEGRVRDVAMRCQLLRLHGLERKEILPYLQHKLHCAGISSLDKIFTGPGAEQLVTAVPRISGNGYATAGAKAEEVARYSMLDVAAVAAAAITRAGLDKEKVNPNHVR